MISSSQTIYSEQGSSISIPGLMSQLPPQKTCDIDFPKIQSHMTDFQNYASQLSQKYPPVPGNTMNTPLLLDNTFYNLTNQLINDITSINIAKLKCMSQNDKSKACQGYSSSQQSIQQMNDLITVLDKYTIPLQKLFNWIKTIGTDYATYCGGNTQQIDKLTQLINKINIITGNICPEQPTISGTNIGLMTTNSCSCISLVLLIFVIIGIVVFISQKKGV